MNTFKASKIMNCGIITNDLPQKIDQSVVRYNGMPFWVRCQGGDNVSLHPIEDTNSLTQVVSVRDPLFDISSIPLGYVNYRLWKTTVWVTRFPVRKYKQGLTSQNIRTHYFPNLLYSNSNGGWPRSADILFTKTFKDSIMDIFPPLENALKGLRGIHKTQPTTHYSVAVSRDIALVIDEQAIIQVFYKNAYVGWIAPNDHIVVVNSANGLGWIVSKYLSEHLGWTVE